MSYTDDEMRNRAHSGIANLHSSEVLRARIAVLEHQLASEKKRVNAQALLITSQEKQLAVFLKQKDVWEEAVKTLDSERAANAELTRQLAVRGGPVAKIRATIDSYTDIQKEIEWLVPLDEIESGTVLYTSPQGGASSSRVVPGWQPIEPATAPS